MFFYLEKEKEKLLFEENALREKSKLSIQFDQKSVQKKQKLVFYM